MPAGGPGRTSTIPLPSSPPRLTPRTQTHSGGRVRPGSGQRHRRGKEGGGLPLRAGPYCKPEPTAADAPRVPRDPQQPQPQGHAVRAHSEGMVRALAAATVLADCAWQSAGALGNAGAAWLQTTTEGRHRCVHSGGVAVTVGSGAGAVALPHPHACLPVATARADFFATIRQRQGNPEAPAMVARYGQVGGPAASSVSACVRTPTECRRRLALVRPPSQDSRPCSL